MASTLGEALVPDHADLPAGAVRAGFTSALDTASVQDVISNLLQQAPSAGLDLRLRAFAYYMENDAFITLSPSA